MKRTLLCLVLLLIGGFPGFTQTGAGPAATFGPEWRSLAGHWVSEASAGTGPGSCAFEFALGDHVLVRTNHADTLPAAGRPGGAHNDLMVIYPGPGPAQARASYWDNEGHVIEYTGGWSADGSMLTFVSKPGGGPQFRLLYKKLDSDSFNVSFDMAPPGPAGAFKTYASGQIHRKK